MATPKTKTTKKTKTTTPLVQINVIKIAGFNELKELIQLGFRRDFAGSVPDIAEFINKKREPGKAGEEAKTGDILIDEIEKNLNGWEKKIQKKELKNITLGWMKGNHLKEMNIVYENLKEIYQRNTEIHRLNGDYIRLLDTLESTTAAWKERKIENRRKFIKPEYKMIKQKDIIDQIRSLVDYKIKPNPKEVKK